MLVPRYDESVVVLTKIVVAARQADSVFQADQA